MGGQPGGARAAELLELVEMSDQADKLPLATSGVSRPLLLSIRNTFRRKGRLAMTLAGLTLGGPDGPPRRSVQAQAALALRSHLESGGIGVASVTTTSDVMTILYAAFDTLVIVVSVMASLLGVVDGLGLTGTMTMNVVERSREIGIIRPGFTDGGTCGSIWTPGAADPSPTPRHRLPMCEG